MTRVRHLEVTFIPKNGIPFIVNEFAFATFQPQVFIKFQVEKQVSSEPNSAFLEIYNLSEDHSSALDFKYDAYESNFGAQVLIKGGYVDDGVVKQMYAGVIVEALTTFEAPNFITRLKCLNIVSELRKRPVTYQASANQLRADAIISIIRQAGGFIEAGQEALLKKNLNGSHYDEDELIKGTLDSVTTTIVKGLPRRAIIYWDDAGVSFDPVGRPATDRPLKIISELNGLIGVPKSSSSGIEYETRLDPTYRINDSVKIISTATARLAAAATRTVTTATDGALGVVFSGITVVSKMIHSGDNREGDFKTSVTTKFIDILQQVTG